jgi:hypothetical protein
MRDHRPDGIAGEATEVAEPARDQWAGFPLLIGSAFLGEYPDGIDAQRVALFRDQADVAADGAVGHGRDFRKQVPRCAIDLTG